MPLSLDFEHRRKPIGLLPGLVTFVPLFGVLWAWLALGEPLTMTMAVAGALILGGVALNQQWGTPRS